MADLKGPGCITHIWMTGGSQDEHYLRALVLRMWWDGEEKPSVEVPLGDFFGLGHARIQAYQSYPFTVSNGESQVGGGTAMNCYFQMPFATSARIEVENQSHLSMDCFYYYIDYEAYDQPLSEDVLRFHAQWRRENPTQAVKSDEVHSRGYWSFMGEPNLDGRENYVILEATGRGHYVGCNLSVDNFDPLPSGNTTWWGEGDDMFYIDGETMPSMTGTGSEDYFCHAWGMQKFSGLYSGTSIWHMIPESDGGGKFTCYRFHIEDPVRFEKSLKVSIEHGHANLQGNDYASTAYFYQTEPHGPYPALPSREARMPRPDFVPPTDLHPKEGPNVRPFIRDWMILGPLESPLTADPVGTAAEDGISRVYEPETRLKSIDGEGELEPHVRRQARASALAAYPAGARGQGRTGQPQGRLRRELGGRAGQDADLFQEGPEGGAVVGQRRRLQGLPQRQVRAGASRPSRHGGQPGPRGAGSQERLEQPGGEGRAVYRRLGPDRAAGRPAGRQAGGQGQIGGREKARRAAQGSRPGGEGVEVSDCGKLRRLAITKTTKDTKISKNDKDKKTDACL